MSGAHLLTGARILPMDAAMTEIPRGWIRIEHGQIAALGPGDPPDGGRGTDMGGDLIMPGMVNAHCHAAMTLFRGLAEDVDDRLNRFILPLERDVITAGIAAAGARLAAAEMIRGGITTLADMYYHEAALARVFDAAGLRAVMGQTVMDGGAPDHATLADGLALTADLAAEFAGHDRITASIAPHAPYSTGMEGMARVAEWADRHPDIPIQIHAAETDAEAEWARAIGLTPVGAMARAGLLRPGLIAAHCLHVTPDDIAALAKAGAGVVHNARANGKAGRGIAPVPAMQAAGIPVGLGSDGPMSGNTLDLFAQFAPVSIFQKLAGRSRKPMPCRTILRMATIDGARALGLGERIGSLEPGKAADLIRLRLDDPRLLPVHDIASALVFAALPTDVVGTMVAGRWLMEERELTTIDLPAAKAGAMEAVARFAPLLEGRGS